MWRSKKTNITRRFREEPSCNLKKHKRLHDGSVRNRRVIAWCSPRAPRRPTRIRTKKINTRKKTISAKRCYRAKITLEKFMCMLLYIYNSACFYIIPPKTQVDISSSILWAGKIHVYVKCKNHSQTINLQRTSL